MNKMCNLEETWLFSNFSSSLDMIEASRDVSIELNELFCGENVHNINVLTGNIVYFHWTDQENLQQVLFVQ